MPGSLRVAVLLIFALPWLTACGYGVVPAAEADAKAAWADVEKQYQHRAATVQLLTGILAGRLQEDMLKPATEAHARAAEIAVGADQLSDWNLVRQFEQRQAVLSAEVDRLLASAANDSRIRADPNFVSLRSNLEASAKATAVARRGYIDATRIYNTALRTMPTLFWAKFLHRDRHRFETLAFQESNALPQKADSGN